MADPSPKSQYHLVIVLPAATEERSEKVSAFPEQLGLDILNFDIGGSVILTI
jgi:hypothetical protein